MTNNIKLNDDERIFNIHGTDYVVKLNETKFRTTMTDQLLMAVRFRDSETSLFVVDPEGVYEEGEDFVLKFSYVKEVIGDVNEEETETSNNDLDNDDDMQGPEDPTIDDTNGDMQERLLRKLAEKEKTVNGDQESNNSNEPKKRKPRPRPRNNNNKNKNKGNNNNNNKVKSNGVQRNNAKTSVENIMKDDVTFDALYDDAAMQFGTKVNVQNFTNVIVGESSIDLALRLKFTEDVDKIGCVTYQEAFEDDRLYGIAYIGYKNPLSGESDVNYYALVLICQKLAVKFADQKIIIEIQDFKNAAKVSRIMTKELSSFDEVFVCKK